MEITGADVGVELLGGTLADINGLDIDDPTQFGVKTSEATMSILTD